MYNGSIVRFRLSIVYILVSCFGDFFAAVCICGGYDFLLFCYIFYIKLLH
jgi:hypothetical protein